MIVDILIALILLIATFLQRGNNRICAMIFAWMTFAHWVFASDLNGWSYYIVSALFDFLIIIVLSAVRPVPKLVLQLQMICFAFIIANIVGFFLWFAYMPPFAYNVLCIVIYTWTLVVLIKRDNGNVGNYTMDRWFSRNRRHAGTGVVNTDNHKG